MGRVILGVASAAIVGAALLGATAARTQVQAAERGKEFAEFEPGFRPGSWHGPRRGPGPAWARLSPEDRQKDRQAFADARVAALHAGLKLDAEQERLWPPVETAIRDLVKLRREQRDARRERGPEGLSEDLARDLPGALRGMADAGTARADALRRLADAAGPLYATLDEGQKRRALVLARPFGGRSMHHGRGGEDRRGPRGPRD